MKFLIYSVEILAFLAVLFILGYGVYTFNAI